MLNSLLSTLLLLFTFPLPIAAHIPYTPSHLLVSPLHNHSLAYLLSGHSGGNTQLLSLNISADVDAANPKYSLLLDKVPFQDDSPFIPVIDNSGIVKVYTGDCQGSDQAAVWQLKPDHASSTGNGTWTRIAVDSVDGISSQPRGPNYLAAGFAYASSNTSDSSLYAFGGMCPFNNESTKDWISDAKYSQSMAVLSPPGSSGNMSYEAKTTGHRAPPIAEAGFTMTPLPPTTATTPAGTMLQQQDFLLIGGQTQSAFINMSELAVFSVPQNSWSFVTVGTEQESAKTELAVRDNPPVEPRSGHTAVLSPDGTKVIVFGGWVGETNVPADPQLAVLEIGTMYGGTGPWTWKVPSMAGLGLGKGSGIYGHGATMLPGGVMMIAGGYTISQSKRSTPMTRQNSQVYLYNVTSSNWVHSYTNPDVQTAKSHTHSGLLSSGQKTGLGVGLGLGLPLVVGLIFLCWVLLRKRQARQQREENIRQLALGTGRSHFWTQDQDLSQSMRRLQMRQIGTWGPDPDRAYPWTGNRGYGGRAAWRDHGEAAAERTGLLVDVPSSMRNSRQGFGARICHISGQHNDYRRSDTTGDIPPIDEREEYEVDEPELTARTQRPELQCPELGDKFDPFADAAFLTPQSTNVGGLYEVPRGSAVFASGHGTRIKDGRSSPEKDHRPTSCSSDSSTTSALAKLGPGPHLSRGAIFAQPSSGPSSGRQSPEKSASQSTHSKETAQNSVDSAMVPVEKHRSADSFSTANTTLSQRQAEGEHLLSQEPGMSTPPESPAKRPRASDWFGSIRRALSVSKKGPAVGTESNFAPVASGIDRWSTVIAPSKQLSGSEKDARPPRRAVSASAELFRRKQGARDWGSSKRSSRESTTFRTPRSTVGDYTLASDGDESDDWGIETAAEGRSVQVTFTVPKEKLRVVNASDQDMDNSSENSISRTSTKRVVSG